MLFIRAVWGRFFSFVRDLSIGVNSLFGQGSSYLVFSGQWQASWLFVVCCLYVRSFANVVRRRTGLLSSLRTTLQSSKQATQYNNYCNDNLSSTKDTFQQRPSRPSCRS